MAQQGKRSNTRQMFAGHSVIEGERTNMEAAPATDKLDTIYFNTEKKNLNFFL